MQTATIHPIIIVIVLLVVNLIYLRLIIQIFVVVRWLMILSVATLDLRLQNHLFSQLVSDVNIL